MASRMSVARRAASIVMRGVGVCDDPADVRAVTVYEGDLECGASGGVQLCLGMWAASCCQTFGAGHAVKVGVPLRVPDQTEHMVQNSQLGRLWHQVCDGAIFCYAFDPG